MTRQSVLIVEDEAFVRLELQSIVEDAGYDVAGAAATGEEAIAIAEQHTPIVALVDISLPGRIDGIKAAEVIRERFQTLVIFVSGCSEGALRERASRIAMDYIDKPFHPLQVKKVLRRILGPPFQAA